MRKTKSSGNSSKHTRRDTVIISDKLKCSKTLFEHIREITSLSEGRPVNDDEIKTMLIEQNELHAQKMANKR